MGELAVSNYVFVLLKRSGPYGVRTTAVKELKPMV